MTQPVTCTHGRTLFQACELCQKETTMSTNTTCDRCHETVLVTTHHGTRDLCLACVEELSGWYAMNFAYVTEAAQRRIEMARAALAAATLALALALLTTHGAAAQEWQAPVTLPSGCPIVQSFEDGSQLAECGGQTYVFDPDGQVHENAAGYPRRLPQHWYLLDPR